MSDARKALGYVRVSTGEQARSELSIPAQRAAVIEYSRGAGLELCEIVEDEAVSARIPLEKRENGARLLRMTRAERGIHVVSARYDRLFRSMTDGVTRIEEWDRTGTSVHLIDLGLVTDPAATGIQKIGRTIVLNSLAIFAELERELISSRTRDALAARKAKGLAPTGRPRYGWHLDEEGYELPLPNEQAVLGRMVSLYESGTSVYAISQILDVDKVPTKTGARWQDQTVRRILKRLYAEGNDEERATAVQAYRDARRKTG